MGMLYNKQHGHQKEEDKLSQINFKDHLKWLRDGNDEEFTFDPDSKSYIFREKQGGYIEEENEIIILKFENLKNDFHNFMKELGMDIRLDVHLRKSKNNNYKKYYDPESNEIVKDLYSEDIENFKYEF